MPGFGGGQFSPPDTTSVPVIVAVVLVVIVLFAGVFGSVFLFFQLARIGPGPGATPIGAVFAAGDPVLSECGTNSSFGSDGCGSSHYRYNLTIETASNVSFSWVQFDVLNRTGAVVNWPGGLGFTVLGGSDLVLGQCAVPVGEMTTGSCGWTFQSGTSASTLLLTTDLIVIDIGTFDPRGQGFAFLVIGVGPASGTTAPVALP